MAQKRNYIGFEVAYSADLYQHHDPGGYIVPADISAALWGLNFRHMLSNNFFLETGIYARAYKIGLAFKNETGSYTTDRTAAILPLRAGARLPIFKGKISFTPVAGISLAMANDGTILKTEGNMDYNGTSIQFKSIPQYSAQTFAMAQAGMGLDIRVGKRGIITANGNWFSGLTNILVQHVTYTVNGGAEVEATTKTRGNFYTTGIGFRYGF